MSHLPMVEANDEPPELKAVFDQLRATRGRVPGMYRTLAHQPGVLAELNQALAAAGLNILGQHLKTNERVGYVITDVDRDYDREALGVLKAVPGTLKFRTLH